MEQSPCRENNRSSASLEIPHILWNPKVHYRIQSTRHLSLSWATPIHSMFPHPTWRSVLILSSRLSLSLPSGQNWKSRGDDSDLDSVPTQKGSTVNVSSQTHASVFLALAIEIVLPPFIFGIFKHVTDRCYLKIIVNTSIKITCWQSLYCIKILLGRVISRELKDDFFARFTFIMPTQISNYTVKMI